MPVLRNIWRYIRYGNRITFIDGEFEEGEIFVIVLRNQNGLVVLEFVKTINEKQLKRIMKDK